MTRAPKATKPFFLAVSGGALSWAAAQETATAGRFVVIPNGWAWFLLGFVLAVGGAALLSYIYGRLTKPQKAGKYALTACKHLFLWVAVLMALYPVIYLVGVSFNRSNALATVPPRVGNLFIRSGILPNPADFSLVQYRRVLGDTHLYDYQWLIIGAALLAVLVFVVSGPFQQRIRVERLRSYSGWATLLLAGALVLSIGAGQFYTVDPSGQRLRASSGGMMVLYIRNTLLVSGLTGLFAVLIKLLQRLS